MKVFIILITIMLFVGCFNKFTISQHMTITKDYSGDKIHNLVTELHQRGTLKYRSVKVINAYGDVYCSLTNEYVIVEKLQVWLKEKE